MKRADQKDQQPTSPSSLKTRLAVNFLRAMKKINETTPAKSQSMADKRKRYHIIKAAAYSSMAISIGPKQAWTRALLSKIKNRTLNRYLTRKSRSIRRPLHTIKRRNPRKCMSGITQEDELRRLVPGGEGMDFCRLLSETAHYMITLKAYIQFMETVLDRFSTHE